MIGTTLKIGFDSTQVNGGLKGIGNLLGRFGRQVGIGIARDVGARVTDLFGRIVTAIPDAMRETADYAGNLNDMAMQTNMSVKELVLLEEKLRLSGVAARDTSRIVSILVDNLHEAQTESGAARDAINKLGFFASDFKDKSPAEAFEMIGRRVSELGPEFKGLEGTMADLFGARMGYGLLRFFKDYDAFSDQAERNTAKFADFMGGKGGLNIDKMGEGMERIVMFRRQLASILMDEISRVAGPDSTNRMFDALDPEKIRPAIQGLTSMLGREIESVLQNGFDFGGMIKNLGSKFADGMKESFKDTFSIGGIAKGLFGMNGATSKPTESDKQAPKQTALLEDLRRMSGIPKFV